jgi:hypothetical protein
MITAKKATVTLPENLRADIDFGYLVDTSTVIRRIAVFYEYARESEELKQIVAASRHAGIFRPGNQSGDIPELQQRLGRLHSVLPIDQLLVLHDSDGFPEKPFRDARDDLEILKHYDSFGVDSVGRIPWRPLLLLRPFFMNGGFSELQFWTYEFGGKTLNAISIPWKYTNAELTESFGRLISKIRPSTHPAPSRAGRKGRYSGAADMLNQLVAFRLHRAGISFDDARPFTLYMSSRGWVKAIIAAEERIKYMTMRPFFSS